MRRDSRLLINEPPLQVLPSLAVAIGLNEALVLQQVHYWLTRSAHAHDGRAWVYNTFEEWRGQFPFWSLRTVKTVFGSLEKQGLLLVGHYHENQWDRTKWYAIDYDALAAREAAPIVQDLHDGACNPGAMDRATPARSSIHTETTTEEDDKSFIRAEGGGLTAARRAALAREHTRGGALDRDGYRQAAARERRG